MNIFFHLFLNDIINNFIHKILILKNHLQLLKKLNYYFIIQFINNFI